MMKFRILLMMALTIFCGVGGGIFLVVNDERLLGSSLYTLFPFAAALLFLIIGYELSHELRSQDAAMESPVAPLSRRDQKPFAGHHPKAA
ncbi:MAG: hypothetical protein HY231_07280 [Acidobacteria bacterium]|nr:hypothetical protein [Acidobacteriota bacterium]